MIAHRRVEQKTGDPIAVLLLAVIQQAQRDIQMGPARAGRNYISAVNFFESPIYESYLEMLEVLIEDFRLYGGALPLPKGVKGKVKRSTV